MTDSDPGLIELESWHPLEFDLRRAKRVDPSRSEYASSEEWNHVEQYVSKRQRISDAVGTDQFIWCVKSPSRFTQTIGKPVKWTLRVAPDRILAYVRDALWEDVLYGRSDHRVGDYVLTSDPGSESMSCLVRFPLLDSELTSRAIWTFDWDSLRYYGPRIERLKEAPRGSAR